MACARLSATMTATMASSNVSAEWAAITPGIVAAALTSTELSVPWAKDDRTK
jgi:hypothetical protein